jgi:preprotein translocase subunit Sec61beta
MGRNDKVSMPSSTAGITRYFDDYKSKISFKPGHIIVLALIIVIIIVFLHLYGYRMLGVQ